MDNKTQKDSYQVIDIWSNTAKHTSATDSTAHFGWIDETSWIQGDSTAFVYDTKFWALTPIYFLGTFYFGWGIGQPRTATNDAL